MLVVDFSLVAHWDWDVAAVSVTAGTFTAEDVAAETVVAVGLYRRRFN